jgi:hypothetical protein
MVAMVQLGRLPLASRFSCTIAISIQEMIFALWLIVTGVNPSAIVALSAQRD